MIPGSLARRYARALLSLAANAQQRDKFASDLSAMDDLTQAPDEQGRPVLAVLQARRFPMAQRTKLLEVLCQRVGADPTTFKFLTYVMERDRINGLHEITRTYRRMADEAAGRVQAEVTSATSLSPEVLSQLRLALEHATGKKVVLTSRLDPDLIGGVVTKVGSYVIDGSVRTALARMRQELRS